MHTFISVFSRKNSATPQLTYSINFSKGSSMKKLVILLLFVFAVSTLNVLVAQDVAKKDSVVTPVPPVPPVPPTVAKKDTTPAVTPAPVVEKKEAAPAVAPVAEKKDTTAAPAVAPVVEKKKETPKAAPAKKAASKKKPAPAKK